MAYYPQATTKFQGVHSLATDSPVPSYQSSSQSETPLQRSPGEINSTFASDTAPSWGHTPISMNNSSLCATALNGESPLGSMVLVSPYSPSLSECSDILYSQDVGKEGNKVPNRNLCVGNRALTLLDQTVGKDVRLRNMSKPHVEPSSLRNKMPHYTSRQQACLRAQELLNETVGGDVVAATSFLPSNLHGETVDTEYVDERVDDIKTSSDMQRQRDANIRALQLLDLTAGQDVSEKARMASDPMLSVTINKHQLGVLTRRALIKEYEEKKLAESKLSKNQKESLKLAYVAKMGGKFLPKPNETGKEALAESSRKNVKNISDYRDPETISGMKGDFEREREEKAQKRALHLMKYGQIA